MVEITLYKRIRLLSYGEGAGKGKNFLFFKSRRVMVA